MRHIAIIMVLLTSLTMVLQANDLLEDPQLKNVTFHKKTKSGWLAKDSFDGKSKKIFVKKHAEGIEIFDDMKGSSDAVNLSCSYKSVSKGVLSFELITKAKGFLSFSLFDGSVYKGSPYPLTFSVGMAGVRLATDIFENGILKEKAAIKSGDVITGTLKFDIKEQKFELRLDKEGKKIYEKKIVYRDPKKTKNANRIRIRTAGHGKGHFVLKSVSLKS